MHTYPDRITTMAAERRDAALQGTASRLRRTLPAQIADEIASRIIAEEYPPGMRLNEVELATEFGVSRSPLREALRILEMRRLVSIEPQRGARVAALSTGEVEELFEIRAVLLGLAAGKVALRHDEGTVASLSAIFQRLEDAVDDPEEYARVSAAMTLAFARASGNPSLLEMIEGFAQRFGRYARLGLATQARRNRSVRNWRAVMKAVRNSDPQRAEVLLRTLALENRDAAMERVAQRELARPGR